MGRKLPTPEVLAVIQSLWALAHALEARSKRMHRDLGITGPQRLVLRAVGESPGCAPGEVARLLHLNPGTVSRLVAGLIRSRLVRREADRGDARRQRLLLTRRGKRLNVEHRGTIEAAVRDALAGSAPGQARAARAFVGRLTEELARADR
jgi:MarR family transcriptional regulator, organic hydroperoxide resistance regulator